METKSQMINRIAKLAQENAELKGTNDRLEHLDEEINDFISDISTCGFKYDDRCPDNLDELQCCIEDLCNKFSNYKQTLQEIKTIAEIAFAVCDDDCGNANRFTEILDLINKTEEE